jgi:hypothetical protein
VGFVAGHGRVLDRRRLERALDPGADPGGLLAALDGYRNADGGYGWGIEPDLRAAESQPCGAMHAFEALAEAGPVPTPRAAELCDWLDAVSLPGGGLPFTLPIADPAGCAPLWLVPPTREPSLQTTAQVAANAHLVARHDPAVAAHPWLARATRWCIDAITGIDEAPFAYELLFALRFLDASAEVEPRAGPLIDQLGRFIPADGVVPVQGGAEGEAIRALQLSPRPGGPARRLFPDELIAAELRRLAAEQQPDGGWTVDYPSSSPAAALEWRGYATVGAIGLLASHGGLTD